MLTAHLAGTWFADRAGKAITVEVVAWLPFDEAFYEGMFEMRHDDANESRTALAIARRRVDIISNSDIDDE